MSNSERKQYKLLRIFISESDRWDDTPLHLAILEACRENGIAGATVLRGIAGYGHHGTLHTDKVLRLSGDLPLVIEIVDNEAKIEKVLPFMQEMAGGGLITMEQIEVVRSSSDE